MFGFQFITRMFLWIILLLFTYLLFTYAGLNVMSLAAPEMCLIKNIDWLIISNTYFPH